MTGNKKISITSLMIVFIIALSFPQFMNGYINLNGSETAYGGYDPPSGSAAYTASQSIEDVIKLGAGYYLGSKENFDTFMRTAEMQEANPPALFSMKESVEDAFTNIKKAVQTYKLLELRAESTPYNNDVITILEGFDYHRFRIANQLNASVFTEVEDFLSRGDITGAFKRVGAACVKIEALLLSVKNTIDSDIVPGITVLQQLNEIFSDTSLFGSYVARVFHSIN